MNISSPIKSVLSLEELITNASVIKRFFERWRADILFRKRLLANPQKTIAKYNLNIDYETAKMLWDEEFRQKYQGNSPAIENFQQFVKTFSPAQVRQELLLSAKDTRFQAWRSRQRARLKFLLKSESLITERSCPLSIELNQGCSMGCWFCGVSASRLEDLFLYTEENQQLWRDVLELMKKVMGNLAGGGFCYHATEPFDNPDYEKFCLDFHQILGVFPQTTTAQALKNPERTKNFLKLSEEKGQLHNRFSILSLKMLSEVHRQFSSRELAFTGLEFRHQEIEAEQPKVNAGRAKNINNHILESEEDLSSGSITTTIGFLLNMVRRSIQLISPCIANERWKDGYRIHATRQFTDASDLKVILEEMIDDLMPLNLQDEDIIRFCPELKFEPLETGFQIGTKNKTYKFIHSAYASILGSLVNQGNLTTREITQQLNSQGVPLKAAKQALNLLYDNGILDDEITFKSLEV